MELTLECHCHMSNKACASFRNLIFLGPLAEKRCLYTRRTMIYRADESHIWRRQAAHHIFSSS